jgi:hypothetical protein
MKALITSGCSVSETWIPDRLLRTWPQWLEEYLQPEYSNHSGLGSIGTDFITRKAIYHCTEALKEYDGKDILLVCAYTTLYRNARLFYAEDIIANRLLDRRKEGCDATWQFQGCNYDNKVLEDSEYPAWFYYNLWRDIPAIDNYYAMYENEHNMREQYLWNLYAVENFCKANNIRYVWTTIDKEFDTDFSNDVTSHWSMSHLRAALDYDYRIRSNISQVVTEHDPKLMGDVIHPTSEGHKYYTQEILIPFLEKHGFC